MKCGKCGNECFAEAAKRPGHSDYIAVSSCCKFPIIHDDNEMSDELKEFKPCPFCGDQPIFVQDEDGFWLVLCDGLDCILRHRKIEKEDAIQLWNKRVQ